MHGGSPCLVFCVTPCTMTLFFPVNAQQNLTLLYRLSNHRHDGFPWIHWTCKWLRHGGGIFSLQCIVLVLAIMRVEWVGVPILWYCIGHKMVAFFLVANPLLVLMASLQANCLLIGWDISPQVPHCLRHIFYPVQKAFYFPIWAFISWRRAD